LETTRSIECSKKARDGLNEFLIVMENAKAILDGIQPAEKSTAKMAKQSTKPGRGKSSKKQELKAGAGLSVCVERILLDSGIAEYHETQDEISGNSKTGNLQQLLNAAVDYPNDREGLLNFLENIELDRSTKESDDTSNNVVTLITFHNTKGLEFKNVIMTGLENGIFPRADKKDHELEEERRLFYVGATRAMDELYLTTCRQRMMRGRIEFMEPSLFLNEIDKSCLMGDTHVLKNGGISSPAAGQTSTKQPITNRNFNTFNLQGSTSETSINAELEKRAGWKRGQRLYNDDRGYGAVVEIKDSDDGPVVHVRFENGYKTSFLSEYQSGAYEKIGDDA